MRSWHRAKGISLLELMVTLAIVGIGMMIALPAYQGLLDRNRLETQAQEFQAAYNYARSEAIRLNRFVVLCQSNDGTVCAAPSSGRWNGWLVRASGATLGAETGPVLRAMQFQNSQVVVTAAFALATSGHAIRFNPQGLVRSFTANAPMSSGVQFCIRDGSNKVQQVQFNSGGLSKLVEISGLCE